MPQQNHHNLVTLKDLPGKAIHDFYFLKSKNKLFVHDFFGPKVEMPISIYFRDFAEMSHLEKHALKLCKGKVMDVGAGAGSHVLELQKKHEAYALEISPNACEVMKARGVRNVLCEDIFEWNHQKFDTIVLLMNGIGLCSNLMGYRKFLEKAKTLINPGGRLIFDSSDISYMFEDARKPPYYFGQVTTRYEYNGQMTDWFQWLYLDQETMKSLASEQGWDAEVVSEDENDQYLAVLSLNN